MKVLYILEMRDPSSGFFQVTMNVDSVSEDICMVTMPAWTPGSYSIKDYAKNVRMLRVKTPEGEHVETVKKDKSTWKILNGNAKSYTITYEVYAGELNVRGCHLDTTHAYFNGTNLFMYLEGYKDQSVELIVKPWENWKISTGMEKIGENKFRATNYDIFVDCPMEIGTHRSLQFLVDGREHEIALYSSGNEDPDKLVNDIRKIVETAKRIFGSLPYKKYVFIIHLLETGSGGLEHLNSTTIGASRFTFGKRDDYNAFLSVVSHEYFHLWNVKRIRPIELGPFNYKEEVYTPSLWVSEGVTNYFAMVILLRAGLITPEEYYEHLASIMYIYDLTPGKNFESASDASLDAWIKLYQPSPNNINSYVSYYLKGEILGFMISLRISEYSKGTKNLDEVMRHMFEKYNKDGKGFTEKDLLAILSDVSGLDFQPFFSRYVKSTDNIDFTAELKRIGLKLTFAYSDKEIDQEKGYGYLGIILDKEGKKVTHVIENSPAQKSGIFPDDEIVAINNFKMSPRLLIPLTKRGKSSLIDGLKDYAPGDRISITLFRRGILHAVEVTLARAPFDKYEISEDQTDASLEKIRAKMLIG